VDETSGISDEERLRRSASFGDAAVAYERYRPGPPAAVIDWLVPKGARSVVDLGAGTGLMTRELIGRVDRVIAIEPDDRMREVLVRNVPGATALRGSGEVMPLESGTVDAVLASSSWHWMDAERTLAEVARVLAPAGALGVVWTGPDPDGPFVAQAQAMLTTMAPRPSEGRPGTDLAEAVLDTQNRVDPTLVIPDASPFRQPEHLVHTWNIALTADELIGLLGTFSWILTMPDERREFVVAEARRILRDGLGVVGEVTVDVQYRSEAWRTVLAG